MRRRMKLWIATVFVSAVIALSLSISVVAESSPIQHYLQTVSHWGHIFPLGQWRSRLVSPSSLSETHSCLYDECKVAICIQDHLRIWWVSLRHIWAHSHLYISLIRSPSAHVNARYERDLRHFLVGLGKKKIDSPILIDLQCNETVSISGNPRIDS